MQAGSSGLQYSPFLLDALLLFGFSDFKLYTFFIFSSFACRSCRRRIVKSSSGIALQNSVRRVQPAICFRQHFSASAVPIAVPYSPSFGT